MTVQVPTVTRLDELGTDWQGFDLAANLSLIDARLVRGCAPIGRRAKCVKCTGMLNVSSAVTSRPFVRVNGCAYRIVVINHASPPLYPPSSAQKRQ